MTNYLTPLISHSLNQSLKITTLLLLIANNHNHGKTRSIIHGITLAILLSRPKQRICLIIKLIFKTMHLDRAGNSSYSSDKSATHLTVVLSWRGCRWMNIYYERCQHNTLAVKGGIMSYQRQVR